MPDTRRPDTTIPRLPEIEDSTYLSPDTVAMGNVQHAKAQQGLKQHGKVNAVERPPEQQQQKLQEGFHNDGIKEHPIIELLGQTCDGVSPQLSSDPTSSFDAEIKFDNEKREQEKKYQMQHLPKFDPKPDGP